MLFSNTKTDLLEHHISKILTIYKIVLRELFNVEIKINKLDQKSTFVKNVISNKNDEYYYDDDIIEFKYIVLCLIECKKYLKLTNDHLENSNFIKIFFQNSLRLRNRLWHPEFDLKNEIIIYCKMVKLMISIFYFIECSYKDYKIIKKEYYDFLQLFLNEFDNNDNIKPEIKINIEKKYNKILNEISSFDFSVISIEDYD